MSEEQYTNYIIVCDESEKEAKNFSYFYGGAIVEESKYDVVGDAINKQKKELGLHEVKRTKITEKNCDDYIKVMKTFFDFVSNGDVKIRVMFAPNNELQRLKKYENHSYTKFYYTFIINAFGIFFAEKNLNLRLILDDLPDTKGQCDIFKKCLINKIKHNKQDMVAKRPNVNDVVLSSHRISEVDSKDHPILQCVDVIVGLVEFALNQTEEEIQKSKRAQARQKVLGYVLSRICQIHPDFNISQGIPKLFNKTAWDKKYMHIVYKSKPKKKNKKLKKPQTDLHQ